MAEDLTLKLCDFNSTLWIDPNNPPTDGAGLGTPAYGAPELTRAISGGAAFGFEVDVWSMGAVLYSLASGHEPFARANSMVDIMHRKRVFFESEENERLRRLNVAEGMSAGGGNSAPHSRKSSLRGRRLEPQPSVVPGIRRESSTDSIESVASNITSMSTRVPSAFAIASLLGDDADFMAAEGLGAPVLDPPGSQGNSPLARAASTHHNARNSLQARLPLPAHLKRATSFQGAQESTGDDSALSSPTSATPGSAGLGSEHRNSALGVDLRREDDTVRGQPLPTNAYGRQRSSGSVSSINSISGAASQLYIAVSQALERAKLQQSQADYMHSNPHYQAQLQEAWQSSSASGHMRRSSGIGLEAEGAEEDLSKEEQAELSRHYADGMPPMILPGGGRLPDAARDLLAKMLRTDPSARPTAKEVAAALAQIRVVPV